MKPPPFVRLARLASLALSLGLAFTVLAPAAVPAAAAAADTAAATTLWNTKLPNAAGVQQSLAQFKGKPLVVNFWASWCGPCVEEMPALSAMHQRYTKKGIQFAGIGVDSAPNVSKFLSKVKVNYPIFVAGFGGADLARSLGDNVGALPFTVVFDGAGRVRYTKLGKIAPQELERELDAL